jgi:hypothetical protein
MMVLALLQNSPTDVSTYLEEYMYDGLGPVTELSDRCLCLP